MAGFPLPEPVRLERLIHDACETLPGPEMARLRELEQRLERQAVVHTRRSKPARRLPWWIVLLLSAGIASAAWWTAERYVQEGPVPEQEQEPAGAPSAPGDTAAGPREAPAADQAHEDGQRGESSVIYRREQF